MKKLKTTGLMIMFFFAAAIVVLSVSAYSAIPYKCKDAFPNDPLCQSGWCADAYKAEQCKLYCESDPQPVDCSS